MSKRRTNQQRGYEAGKADALAFHMSRAARLLGTYAVGYRQGYQENCPFWVASMTLRTYCHDCFKTRTGLVFDLQTKEKVDYADEPAFWSHKVVLHDDGSLFLQDSKYRQGRDRIQRGYLLRHVKALWSTLPPAERQLLLETYRDYWYEPHTLARQILRDWYEDHNLPTLALLFAQTPHQPKNLPLWPRDFTPAPVEFDRVFTLQRRHWVRCEGDRYIALCGVNWLVNDYYQDRSADRPLCATCFLRKPIPPYPTWQEESHAS
jgi:hypothetical protein